MVKKHLQHTRQAARAQPLEEQAVICEERRRWEEALLANLLDHLNNKLMRRNELCK